MPGNVPAGFADVVVMVNGVSSNAQSFLVIPTIEQAPSQIATVGTPIVLTGTSFGDQQGSSSTVTFGSVTAIPTTWSNTSITVPVPPGAGNGFIVVTVNGFATNGVPFYVQPNITNLSPVAATVDSLVTIAGTGFGASPGFGGVTFNGVSGNVQTWNDSVITVTVPQGATTGNVVVTNGTFVSSSGVNFTVILPPVINSLNPASGPIGTRITLTGSNFGATQGNGQVQIGNQAMIVDSWSDSSVVATVPAEGATGNLVLTADSGLSSNGGNFTVTFGGPVLQLSIADAPLQVNLTSPQTLDWIHWGRVSATLPDRKGGIAPLISDYTVVGGTQPSAGSGNIAFSWSDGDHPPIVSETTADVEAAATGSGFQITVPADTDVKTLNLYAEVFFGQGQLQASLSDGSAAAISDQSVTDLDLGSKIYSIDFRAASPGQTLTVTFTSLSGFVGLQAATLTPHLPLVSITSPAAGQMFPAPGTIPFSATTSQFDSSVTGVQATGTDGSVLQVNGPTLNASWGPLAAGHYSITATASDSAGLTNTSSPVETDVIGQGGSLSIQENVPSSPIDLDAQGTGDWVLWGPLNTGDTIINNPGNVLARKAGVAPLISDYKLIGNHGIHASAFAHSLDFTSASQNLNAAGSQIAVFGLHDGFEITAPADTTPRTLQLYVGVISGDLSLTGFLSDGSAPVATEIGGTGPPAPATTLYTINYSAASSGQTLTLRLTLGSDQGSGEAVLIGAALNGPSVAPIAPAPQIASINPPTAATDTQVTITGTNFGAKQGDSQVLFGSFSAHVVSWSDTSIVVVVPATLTAGQTVDLVVFADQGNSNAVSFTVLSYKLYPPSLSLVVGQSTSVTPKDSSGNPVTGLGWTTSDPSIVSLSTDDPPVITALAVGSATVYAGDAALPVTVYPGTSLPPGTVLWSAPLGSGSGNISIVPAVPSDSGADVFALDDTGTLTALASDSTPVWKVPGIPGGSSASTIPDFAGNALVKAPYSFTDAQGNFHATNKIFKADPTNGLTYLYTFQNDANTGFNPVTGALIQTAIPHPGGLAFIQDNAGISLIDPSSGQSLASIALDNSTFNGQSQQPFVGQMIVAGDGNAYVPYVYSETTETFTSNPAASPTHNVTHSMLLRVSPDGSSAKTELRSWTFDITCGPWTPPGDTTADGTQCTSTNQGVEVSNTSVITNADAGVAVFTTSGGATCTSEFFDQSLRLVSSSGCPDGKAHTEVAYVSQDAVTSNAQDVVVLPNNDGRLQGFVPLLQREDGSYIGTDTQPNSIWAGSQLIAVSGVSMLWNQTIGTAVDPTSNAPTAPFLSLLYATDDGGVIVRSAQEGNCQVSTFTCQTVGTPTIYTVDQNGNVTGRASNTGAVPSWIGSWYAASEEGASAFAFPLLQLAGTFAALPGGNHSGTGTAIQQVLTNQPQGSNDQLPPTGATLHPTYHAIELLTSTPLDNIFNNYILTFKGGQGKNNDVMNSFIDTPTKTVTAVGQKISFVLYGVAQVGQGLFSVRVNRLDPTSHTMVVVTQQGHPLDGWRYWRVFSVGTNDVVVETGAADRPHPGPLNYIGYYLFNGQLKVWQEFLQFIQKDLKAPEGTNPKYNIVKGTRNYDLNYILQNMCLSCP